MTEQTHPKSVEDPSSSPLAEVIFDRILDAIYQGRMAPGTVVNEAALAQEFGVSRSPVREAIRRLQGIQLISREAYMKARVITLSAQTCLDLFQMRMVLEGLACNLATKRMSDAQIDQIARQLDEARLRQPVTLLDGREDQKTVFDFHEHIVRACGNERIINALCGDLYHLLRMYRRHSKTSLENKDNTYKEHWQILRAIQARDAELAESLMRLHVERAAGSLMAQLAEESKDRDRLASKSDDSLM